MQFRSLNVSTGGSSEGSGPALLDFYSWELCFSLVSPLGESCYSLASCLGMCLERAVPFMSRLLHFLFFFFFLFFFLVHSSFSLSFRTNSFHSLLFFSSFPSLSFLFPSSSLFFSSPSSLPPPLLFPFLFLPFLPPSSAIFFPFPSFFLPDVFFLRELLVPSISEM